MRKTATYMLAAAVMGMSACGGADEAAAPPTPEDALTSAEPTTEAPPADPAPTTKDVEPTTAAPTTEAAADEFDHSEEGAEAFARHYIDLINSTGTDPEEGVLEPLATEECDTCANFAENVQYLVSNDLHNTGDVFEVTETRTLFYEKEAVVTVAVNQLAVDVVDADGNVADSAASRQGTMKIDLIRSEGQWLVDAIFVGGP